MAKLRDANGRISIDEAEAEAEIKKIEQVKMKLEEVQKLLTPSKLDSKRMCGETFDALEEVFSEFSTELKVLKGAYDAISTYIRNTVIIYQDLDRDYARKISGNSNGGFSGSGGGRRF